MYVEDMDLFGLGPAEIILILFVILLLFGPKKLPDLARGIGTAFRELKEGFSSKSKNKKS